MAELRIPEKNSQTVTVLVNKFQELYANNLISIIAYGSAVSGGFVPKRSHVDIILILKDASLENLKKAHALVKKNTLCHILFFDEDFIARSLDTFPIEFLDIKEGYLVLLGKDIFQDKVVDKTNLRFQCEAEIKEKLLALKQQYIIICRDALALRQLLLVSFSSILHILKSALRLYEQEAPGTKEEIIRACGARFGINIELWKRILSLKNRESQIAPREIEAVFMVLVKDLEKVSYKIDAL